MLKIPPGIESSYKTIPYGLIAKLLYGCGLRLSECLSLRVNNFNFGAGVLTVHDGKRQKDRTLPFPMSLVPELRKRLEP